MFISKFKGINFLSSRQSKAAAAGCKKKQRRMFAKSRNIEDKLKFKISKSNTAVRKVIQSCLETWRIMPGI